MKKGFLALSIVFVFTVMMGEFLHGDVLRDYGLWRNDIENEARFGRSITNDAGIREIEEKYLSKFKEKWAKRYEIEGEVGIDREKLFREVSNEIVSVIKSGLIKRLEDKGAGSLVIERWVERVKELVGTNDINRWEIDESIRKMYEVSCAGFGDITNEFMSVVERITSSVGSIPSFLLDYIGEEGRRKVIEGIRVKADNYLKMLINIKQVEIGKFVRKARYDDDSLRWYSEHGSAEWLMREEIRALEDALSEFPAVEGMSEEEFIAWRNSVRGKYIDGIRKWDELFNKMTEGMNNWLKEARENYEEGEK